MKKSLLICLFLLPLLVACDDHSEVTIRLVNYTDCEAVLYFNSTYITSAPAGQVQNVTLDRELYQGTCEVRIDYGTKKTSSFAVEATCSFDSWINEVSDYTVLCKDVTEPATMTPY